MRGSRRSGQCLEDLRWRTTISLPMPAPLMEFQQTYRMLAAFFAVAAACLFIASLSGGRP